VRWRATDAVGNATTGGVDLTLDTTRPPQPVLTYSGCHQWRHGHLRVHRGRCLATLECRLDAGAFAPCASPVDYAALTAGIAHLPDARDGYRGQRQRLTSYTWTANVDIPNVAITFPNPAGRYNDSGFTAGCGTSTGDLCGTASDAGAISMVEVSLAPGEQRPVLEHRGHGLRQHSRGLPCCHDPHRLEQLDLRPYRRGLA
jgi:hypothetical protein